MTGSHLYGFASADSDLDLKGIHVAPTAAVLGLSDPPRAHDCLEVVDGVELDLTLHEVGQALNLLLQGNGNMLERITSPLQLVEAPEVQQLQALVPAALSRTCYGHYRGFFRGIRREHLRTPKLKTLLYTYRVALTGVHLLRTGEVIAHLPTLADQYGFPEVQDWIGAKVSGGETVAVDADVDKAGRARWDELESLLDAAREASVLPDAPPDPASCNAWLVALRSGEVG